MWANYHDVSPLLTPFPHRKSDPIVLGSNIATTIREAPETQMELTRDGMDVGEEWYHQLVMELLKCHRVLRKEERQDCVMFWNPEYIHYDTCFTPIEDTDKQIQFYETHASIGIVTPKWLATHLGMSVDTLREFVERNTDHDSLADTLADGRKTMARTAYTALEWTEYSLPEVATGFGISKTKLQHWVQTWVDECSWKPPQNPSDKDWLKAAQNH